MRHTNHIHQHAERDYSEVNNISSPYTQFRYSHNHEVFFICI
jgi:hypothetical protein